MRGEFASLPKHSRRCFAQCAGEVTAQGARPWVPWVAGVLASGATDGWAAADASVGYRFGLSERTSLDAKLLGVWSRDWGSPCGDTCNTQTDRLFFFPAAGATHRFGSSGASGFLLGADLTLAVFSLNRSDDSGWHTDNIPPWAGVAFSRLYAGYQW